MIGDPDPVVTPLNAPLQQIEANAEKEILNGGVRGVFVGRGAGHLKDDAANSRRGPHRNRALNNQSHHRHDAANVEVAPNNLPAG